MGEGEGEVKVHRILMQSRLWIRFESERARRGAAETRRDETRSDEQRDGFGRIDVVSVSSGLAFVVLAWDAESGFLGGARATVYFG